MDNASTLHETKRFRCLEYHQKQTEDLYLTLCGVEHCTPGNIFYPEGRSGYHLHVILSGKGTICIDGREQRLHFGQMFMTKPGEDGWYKPDDSDPWTYCWMTFDGTNAPYYAESAGFREGVNALDCYVDPQEFHHLTQRILDRPELSLANDLLRLGILLEYLSLAVESNYKSSQVVRRHHEYAPDVYVNHALDFIRYNYASIKVNDVAKYIGINRSYLTNIFKKKMGISPQEYLLQYRLNRGCELLLETRCSIQEIAQKIGYENPLTFSKMFKNVYGVSPRNYRMMGGVVSTPTGDKKEKTAPAGDKNEGTSPAADKADQKENDSGEEKPRKEPTE
ncbi:MAG: AraC family transcriptional regulator [Clostridiales bacterium]|nr:AraC family transcriptional regulator [Clostridiales bacterium]